MGITAVFQNISQVIQAQDAVADLVFGREDTVNATSYPFRVEDICTGQIGIILEVKSRAQVMEVAG